MTSFAPMWCCRDVRFSSSNVTDETSREVSSCLSRLRSRSDLSGKGKVRDPAVIGQYRVVAPPPQRRQVRKIRL